MDIEGLRLALRPERLVVGRVPAPLGLARPRLAASPPERSHCAVGVPLVMCNARINRIAGVQNEGDSTLRTGGERDDGPLSIERPRGSVVGHLATLLPESESVASNGEAMRFHDRPDSEAHDVNFGCVTSGPTDRPSRVLGQLARPELDDPRGDLRGDAARGVDLDQVEIGGALGFHAPNIRNRLRGVKGNRTNLHSVQVGAA